MADRPGFTDGPVALPARSLQIEAGVTADRVPNVTYWSVGELLLRAGLGARTELRVFGNSYGIRRASGSPATHGLEDLKLGAKLALRAPPDSVRGVLPRLALLAATTLPTGAANRTANKAQPEAKLAASWTTTGPLSFYSNLGVAGVYDGTAWGSRGFGSLAVWFAAGSTVSLFGEGFVARRIGGSATAASYLDGGLTLLLSSQLQADVRAGHGVGGSVGHEGFIGVGMAWRW